MSPYVSIQASARSIAGQSSCRSAVSAVRWWYSPASTTKSGVASIVP
jgi:hypothetical protein